MKHHYVPEFYLRAFTDPECPAGHEPYVWVVDLDDGAIRRRAPMNAAALTDYYAVGDGEDRQAIEQYLSAVEGWAAPVIKKVLGDDSVVDGSVLDVDEKAALSIFAAAQVARVPSFRNRIEEFMTGISKSLGSLMIRSRETNEQAVRQAHPDREFTVAELDELYEEAKSVGPEAIVANPTAALGHALNAVSLIKNLFCQMSWAVMMPAASGNFWTSDNPVYWINTEASHPVIGHGLAAKGVEVNFPIGPQRCVLMTWTDIEGRFPVNDLLCAQERGIVGASRYLFCGTEADARSALAAHRRMYPRRAVSGSSVGGSSGAEPTRLSEFE